ncbi:hypothetical protein [Marinobacter sp. UBA2498]|jgi:hypothetical protein|uniref:hypothetical protein n=1 Tax=Marinobacter sp. UBA2498 TaxID=1946813 RepID=UPI00257D8566|nr:hypothetical protein [Marinobacter sp. UBA2498]|tara:strand:- start:17066 stop:17524 length:459 start_codon:yes stop_codon:yes gene_type:complete
MSEPKALRLIRAVQAALETIQGNGFYTEAGARVTRGRKRIGKDEAYPLLIIHEGEEEATKRVGDQVHNRLNITIEGWCDADPLNPLDDAHLLLADIKKAVFSKLEPRAHPGLFSNVGYLGRVIDPPEDGSRLCSVSVLLAIDWAERLTDPMN